MKVTDILKAEGGEVVTIAPDATVVVTASPAEVLSADAYAAFEEAQKLGPAAVSETGKRYLAEILSVGGSRPALESFTAFRGREPKVDALLRHSGMISA